MTFHTRHDKVVQHAVSTVHKQAIMLECIVVILLLLFSTTLSLQGKGALKCMYLHNTIKLLNKWTTLFKNISGKNPRTCANRFNQNDKWLPRKGFSLIINSTLGVKSTKKSCISSKLYIVNLQTYIIICHLTLYLRLREKVHLQSLD